MSIIENVGLQGCLCVLDDKPKRVSTCLSCTLDACDIPSMRARLAGIYPVIEGEYHVTEAIGPPLITKFRRENPYYVSPDSLIPMFMGTAVHEKIENENLWYHKESGPKYLGDGHHEVFRQYKLGEHMLVGTMDYVDFNRKLILDYKTCGAWKCRSLIDKAANGEEDEYFHQLNVYRAAFYPEAETLRLHVFLKDFSANAQRMYKLKSQEYRIDVPIYDAEKELEMVRANIEESLKDEPRNCTPEETWGSLRCRKFCNNYNCFHYEGPRYNPEDVE